MSLDPATLLNDTKCYACYSSSGINQLLKLGLLRLLALAADPQADVSPQALLSKAQCYACYIQQAQLLELALLDTIASTALNKPYGFLSLSQTQLIAISVAGTYVPITHFDLFTGSNFVGDTAKGSLTNNVAGFYRISLNASLQAPTSNDSVEIDVLINGAQNEAIASHTTSPSVASRAMSASCQGILFLPAGTLIEIGVTDASATGNITVIHAQITVDQP